MLGNISSGTRKIERNHFFESQDIVPGSSVMFLLLPELIYSPGTCSMDSAVNTLQRAGCGEPEPLRAPCLAAQSELVEQCKEGLWELFCSDWLVQRIFLV